MLERLRARFAATLGGTFALLERAAAQLARTPADAGTLESVRRELHRIHGTAGTFGYREAGHVAARMEQRALEWSQYPELDADSRGVELRQCADELRAAFGEPAAQAPLAEPEQRATQGADPDVVLVEDDSALADMIRFGIESADLRVAVFHDGATGLCEILSLPARGTQRLLVLDVDLPGMDGHSIHERVRAERPGEFAVVFVSARSGESEQLRGLRGGAIDYLTKPLSLRVLLAKIQNWLPALRPRA